MNHFDNIKQAAKRHGLTMKEVSERLGMTCVELRERVNSNEYNLEDMTQIAKAIGCEIYEFIGNYNPEEWFRCPHCGKKLRISTTINILTSNCPTTQRNKGGSL